MIEASPVIRKEATWRKTGRLKSTTCPATYFDATGCSISGYLTKDLKTGARIALAASFTDAPNGIFEISLSDGQIAALEFVSYKMRIIITFPSGDKTTATVDNVRVLP